jgi:molybdopterin synthase catalytic subunit
MKVLISKQMMNPWDELQHYQKVLPHCGATAVFVGTMRDINENDKVIGLFLEHYPKMTQTILEDLCYKAIKQYALLDILLVHRVGHLSPTDPIVLVAAWSMHRAEAFIACREIMEQLKTQAPFWKKEKLAEGKERWVEKNTPSNTLF